MCLYSTLFRMGVLEIYFCLDKTTPSFCPSCLRSGFLTLVMFKYSTKAKLNVWNKWSPVCVITVTQKLSFMQALLLSCVWRTEPAGGTQALFIFDFNSETVLHLSGFLRFDILPKTGTFLICLFVSRVTFTSLWRKFLMALASTSIGTIWSCIAGPWNGICFMSSSEMWLWNRTQRRLKHVQEQWAFGLLEASPAVPSCPLCLSDTGYSCKESRCQKQWRNENGSSCLDTCFSKETSALFCCGLFSEITCVLGNWYFIISEKPRKLQS